MNKIAVIMYGAPGSGKSTQAELLSKKIGVFHFDTGDYLRQIFDSPALSDKLKKEKEMNKSGGLNTPSWILKIVSKRIGELSKLGQSVVLSGSPRTVYEAFGQKESGGIYKLLEKLYGKQNIHIFALDILEKESIKRNSLRVSCSVCKTPLLVKIPNCPICGGKTEHRKDDKKEIIIERLKEYHRRTEPIFSELKNRKFNFNKIDGTLKPYEVHNKILKYFI